MTKETLQLALEALTDFDYDKRMKAIEIIKEALETKDEPIAWGMEKDGVILDVISPEEHDREEGGYTVPLYTITPQQEVKNETAQQRINKLPLNDSFERDEAARNIVREFMRNH